MERFRDDAELSAALRALRPAPRSQFAAELDERAAAGFPRRAAEGSTAEGLLARVRALRPRQVLLPAGATAVAAIVLVTAVVAVEENGSERETVDRVAAGDTAKKGFLSGRFEEKGALVKPDPAIQQYSESASAEEAQPLSRANSANLEADVGASGPGAFSTSTPHRDVERSAEMVLGVERTEVGEASAQVFDAVHTYDGIVLRSSTDGGSAGDAGAVFDLLIPSARLGDALAAFSQIGEVRSRHEATTDITAPTVTVSESLRDSRARIDGLLAQLAATTTESEREAVEAELGTERRRAASLRARRANLDRRATLSRVSVRIETGAGAVSSGEDSSWGLGDALGDAGHILGIAAAVTVVGLAVLAPIALLALLAWLAQRAWLRRGRERALS